MKNKVSTMDVVETPAVRWVEKEDGTRELQAVRKVYKGTGGYLEWVPVPVIQEKDAQKGPKLRIPNPNFTLE